MYVYYLLHLCFTINTAVLYYVDIFFLKLLSKELSIDVDDLLIKFAVTGSSFLVIHISSL